jgi:hypothetical protein
MASHVRATRFSAVMVRARAALCSVGLLAILVACSGNAPPQAKPVGHARGIPAGFSEFRDSGRGYELAVPSSWIQINVQSPDAAAVFAQVLKKKPQLTQVFGDSLASLEKQDVSLLAIGPAGTGVNMVVTPGGSGTLTAAQLGTVYSTEVLPNYSRAGIKVLSHQVSSLDGYPALRLSTTAVLGKVFHETQFLAGVHGKNFVLTITDAAPTLINQIAGTVRFL